MERKTIWLVGALTLVLLFAGLGTSLAVVDRTGTVPAAATIGASTSLTVQAKKITDNTNVTSIDFGSLPGGTGNKLAAQYVELNVASNYGVWELEIYTNNFAATTPSTTTWGYQYGGMKGAIAGNRAPMVWQAYRVTTAVSDPPVALTGWTYLKDKKDLDIPVTPLPADESWAKAHIDGYTNIAYGGPDYMNVVEPGTTGVPDTDKKLMVYLGGLFGSAAADTYGTTVGIDLYHE
jgi:hypothetical protein